MKRKAEVSMETLVKIILGLIVLITVLVSFYYGYSKLMSISGVEWGDLSFSEQKKVESNFNKMVETIQGCNAKSNCFCGNETGFPFAFREEETIVLDNSGKGKTNITLKHKDLQIKSISIPQNIFLNSGEFISKEVSFKSGAYYVNGVRGLMERPAFVRTGDSMYIFNEDVKKDNAVYRASLSFKAC